MMQAFEISSGIQRLGIALRTPHGFAQAVEYRMQRGMPVAVARQQLREGGGDTLGLVDGELLFNRQMQ